MDMPLYRYVGRNMESKTVKGKCSAKDESELYGKLKKEGIFLTGFAKCNVNEHTAGILKPVQLSEVNRDLAAMTGAGITIQKAVEILQKGSEEPRILKTYVGLERRLNQGCLLSEAMEEMGMFPEMMVNMYRAAEATGKTEATASRLAVHYQKEHRMENQIRTAFLYPKILLLTAVFVVLCVFWVVIPTVEPLFEGMKLPVITKILMEFSRIIKENWYMVLPALLVPVILVRILMLNENVLLRWDKFKLHLPVVGKQLRIIYTARFARSQSSLYHSGLPMVRSLEIAGKTLGNKYLEAQFGEIIRDIRGGESLSHAVSKIDGLDGKLSPVIYVGEETGKLDVMLESIADNYEHESETALNRLVAMIEPVIILMMSVAVGGILLGIMLPMWNMYGNIG